MKRFFVALAALVGALAPAAAERYDFRAYLGLVEARSKDLELARTDIAAARSDIKAAYAAVLPTVGASAGYLRNLSTLYYYQGGQKIELTGNDNQLQLGVQANQNLFNLQALSGVRASAQYSSLSVEIYEAQRAAILTGAKKLFYLALLLQRVHQVRQASEQAALENYQNVQRKFENGLVSQLAVLQAEVTWRTGVPETTLARRNLELALLNLKDLAGLAHETQVDLEGSLDDTPDLPAEVSATAILEARPDYRALRMQQRLREIGVEAARQQSYPVVGASLLYGFSAQSDELKLEQENNALQLQLNVTVPIFSGGYISSQVSKAQTELARASIGLDKKRQEISIEIDEVTLRLREARERILTARAIVSTAEKALAIARTAADSGMATQLELKDAQVSYDGARLSSYVATYDYLSACFDWERATGRAASRTP